MIVKKMKNISSKEWHQYSGYTTMALFGGLIVLALLGEGVAALSLVIGYFLGVWGLEAQNKEQEAIAREQEIESETS